MKVYISADIEGVTGVTNWNETELNDPEHAQAAAQMKKEVLAACEAAIECGADEIVVKDAHDSARNLAFSDFPDEVTLIRGWTRNPYSMMAGIDDSFDAAIFIGYHSAATCPGNPLSHTMDTNNNYIKINGEIAAEFDMNTYLAAYHDVPVVFVSGDEMLCEHAKELVPEIETVGVKYGIGSATFNMPTNKACRLIKEGVAKALTKTDACKITLPDHFTLEINYKEHFDAYRCSFFPGAELVDSKTVRYEAKDIMEMMIARMFIQ